MEQVQEAGKTISEETLAQLQTIHDVCEGLGTACHKKLEMAGLSSEADTGVIITSDVAVRESATFCEVVDIQEGARQAAITGKPTTIPVKIIQPGWGSMAYYPKKVIQESGPAVFKSGTQMFWNHDTTMEESSRPEGDLSRLAAVFTKDAYWDENGPKGPGLYSEAKVFSDYATQVSEKGPHIGVSINAGIKCHEGEMDGRTGKIADRFTQVFSTDFVTKAGAGGAPIVPVQEADRGNKETDMEVQEAEALRTENETLKATLKRMEASQNHVLAVATVGSVLKEAGIRYSQSLLERACENPVIKEGKVDADWAKATAALFTEGEAGRVTGLGATASTTRTTEAADEKLLRESLKSLGVPEAGLDYAVAGRV